MITAITCYKCGRRFTAGRVDAKFCSRDCLHRHYRQVNITRWSKTLYTVVRTSDPDRTDVDTTVPEFLSVEQAGVLLGMTGEVLAEKTKALRVVRGRVTGYSAEELMSYVLAHPRIFRNTIKRLVKLQNGPIRTCAECKSELFVCINPSVQTKCVKCLRAEPVAMVAPLELEPSRGAGAGERVDVQRVVDGLLALFGAFDRRLAAVEALYRTGPNVTAPDVAEIAEAVAYLKDAVRKACASAEDATIKASAAEKRVRELFEGVVPTR